MTRLFFLLPALAILLSISSCKKDCGAGTGGNLTIAAFPKHHGAETKARWAYVKFNTSELPGTNASDYDLVVEGDTSENHVHLENLKCGDYYIYMISYDPAINDTTTGGIPFSTEKQSGEIDLDVPVTE